MLRNLDVTQNTIWIHWTDLSKRVTVIYIFSYLHLKMIAPLIVWRMVWRGRKASFHKSIKNLFSQINSWLHDAYLNSSHFLLGNFLWWWLPKLSGFCGPDFSYPPNVHATSIIDIFLAKALILVIASEGKNNQSVHLYGYFYLCF